MLYIICAACVIALAILIFLCFYFGFRAGARLGMQVSQGRVPQKLDPVDSIIKAVSNAKNAGKDDLMTAQLKQMLTYDGNPKPKEKKE